MKGSLSIKWAEKMGLKHEFHISFLGACLEKGAAWDKGFLLWARNTVLTQ